MLASTTRRAVLLSDAVPTIFPNIPKYLSKSVKRRKRPASRKPKDTSAKKILSEGEACQTTKREAHMETDSMPSIVSDHDTENAGSLRPGPSCSGSHGENKERDLDASVRDAEDAVCSLNDSACDDFECLFRNQSFVRLPSMYWSWSRVDLGEHRILVFHNMQAKSTAPDQPVDLYVKKCMELDNNLNLKGVMMGKIISLEELRIAHQLSTLKDLQDALQTLDDLNVCPGGPDVSAYPHMRPHNARADVHGKWRHTECFISVEANQTTCSRCVRLRHTLRTHQKRFFCKEGTAQTIQATSSFREP